MIASASFRSEFEIINLFAEKVRRGRGHIVLWWQCPKCAGEFAALVKKRRTTHRLVCDAGHAMTILGGAS